MKNEVILVEGAVGEIGKYSVGASNIWTREGELSAQISVWNAQENTKKICKQGDELKIGSMKIKVKAVKENDNGTGSVTLQW